MEPFVKVVDNFYDNPDIIREHALSQKYQKFTSSYYAGNDSISRNIITDECKLKLQNILGSHIKFTQARYRYARSKDYSVGYIHSDITRELGGKGYHVLIYLTPDEYKMYDDGVSFYDHHVMGRLPGINFDTNVFAKDCFNVKKFNKYKHVDHKYNRAIILDYNYFHTPNYTHGFGNDLEHSRLLHIIEVVPSHTIDTSLNVHTCKNV